MESSRQSFFHGARRDVQDDSDGQPRAEGKRGINLAVSSGELYHLWFYPFNLNEDSDAMLWGLDQIFPYANRMREQGLLEILTMDDYARRLEREKPEERRTAERGRPGGQAEAQLSV